MTVAAYILLVRRETTAASGTRTERSFFTLLPLGDVVDCDLQSALHRERQPFPQMRQASKRRSISVLQGKK